VGTPTQNPELFCERGKLIAITPCRLSQHRRAQPTAGDRRALPIFGDKTL
jgi:hypothetical protein